MKPGLSIKAVEPFGLAATLGLQKGDCILTVNGEPVQDFLDWNFYASGGAQSRHGGIEPLQLEVLRNDRVLQVRGQESGVRGQVERLFPAPCALTADPCLSWGITFAEPRFRHCGNRCIFCFVDQLPPGSRQSLCFKDEDYRLSFWHGNYITLTNLREPDFERIFRQRLSPLYISVHATDDEIRRFLLGNPKAPAILPLLRRLVEGKIALHTQIVICPGINNGEVLDKTLDDLSTLAPGILSLAIIPVGLTKFRRSLYPLRRVTPQQAKEILKQLIPWQKKFRRETGSPWVYASDELYLLAEKKIPPASFYGDYPQIENGVGLLRSFWEEIKLAKKSVGADPCVCPPSKITSKGRTRRSAPTEGHSKIIIVTGELFAPHLKKAVDSLPFNKSCINVIAVKNNYLGRQVTVAGLVAGRDILNELRRSLARHAPTDCRKILIPSVMLKTGGEVFIDDLSLKELKQRLGLPVEVVPPTGKELLEVLLKEISEISEKI